MLRVSILAATAFAATVAQAPAPAPAESARPDNYYAAANRIVLSAPMPADVVVAGRDVELGASIAGDVLAAGWHVRLTGSADDDVRIAGGDLVLDAPVAGDLTAAGGSVTVGPRARVTGRSWLSGGTVRVEGVFERDLHVAGETVYIGGEVREPLEVVAERLEIQRTARLLGGLTHKGPTEARVAEGAVVNGPIRYSQIPQAEARRAREFAGVSGVLFVLHVFLAGVLVLAFAPRSGASLVTALRQRPGRSLLTGAVLLIGVPIAAVVLVVSVIGLPLGLVLAAAYAVAMFASLPATAFFVGDAEARLLARAPMTTRSQQAFVLLAGVLTLAVMRGLLGGVVVLASVLCGLGALAVWAWGSYGRATATPPPASA